MKQIITGAALALSLFYASVGVANGAGAKWVYIHDGSFMTDYALVERTDGFYKGDIYLVELGMGCTGITWGQDKWALWITDTTFLDGIGDTFYDVSRDYGNECKVWDAFDIDDWKFNLSSYEHAEFFRAINSL